MWCQQTCGARNNCRSHDDGCADDNHTGYDRRPGHHLGHRESHRSAHDHPGRSSNHAGPADNARAANHPGSQAGSDGPEGHCAQDDTGAARRY